MPTKVFWTEPTGEQELYLRRYVSGSCHGNPGQYSYHNAKAFLKRAAVEWRDPDDKGFRYIKAPQEDVPNDDPRWPTKCESCDYMFNSNDTHQIFNEQIYRRVDTGEEISRHRPTPGMMWDAWWLKGWMEGDDGISLVVVLPNGREWQVDSSASNCDSPCKHCGSPLHVHKHGDSCQGYEDARPHKCWIRHGDPKTGNIHVDKNGVTCGAGAGSILSGNYHGFLHDGFLTDG